MEISFRQLRQEAKHQGFPIIGTLKPHYFKDLKEILTRYVDEGYTFEFNKKSIEEKCDPFLTMENCKTIVVLGLPYYSESNTIDISHTTPDTFRGRLARTAWGEDYHRVFQRKMQNLGEALGKNKPGVSYQSYVDTGPLVERFLASKAGLGFYGYNILFYHHEYGSYVFYGYMLIDLEVCDVPGNEKKSCHGSVCENCNKCIKACPGQAIVKPYRLNASRCISGIMQKKGVLSDEEKALMGNRIYGCDVCQEICPYNKELKSSSDPAFIPGNPPAFPDLRELLGVSNKEFIRKYGNNASAWRGARVLKRNALVALGNIGDPGAMPYIFPFINDTREDLRDAAQWALKKLETESKE